MPFNRQGKDKSASRRRGRVVHREDTYIRKSAPYLTEFESTERITPYPMMERGRKASMMGPRRRRRSERKAATTGRERRINEISCRESREITKERCQTNSSTRRRRHYKARQEKDDQL
jgi:hypothetical protein